MVNVVRTWFLACCILMHGCARAEAPDPQGQDLAPRAVEAARAATTAALPLDKVSRKLASRRVVRNAEIALEARDQLGAEQRIVALAESLGGFTVNSERHQSDGGHAARTLAVDLTVRIPSERFVDFVAQVRSLADRVGNETTTGQDVSDEFIDLEARIVAERALETQYLEIMKESKNVKDALEIYAQLADVRERIEKAEGRKRFLENQTSMSTVHVSILNFVPDIRTHGFGIAAGIRAAAGDVLNVGALLVVGTIRTLGYLIPIAAVLGGPFSLVLWIARARAKRNRARALAESTAACQ